MMNERTESCPVAIAEGTEGECAACRMGLDGHCWSDDADECAMCRERAVAGTSDEIPSCPIHDGDDCPECARSFGPRYSGPCEHGGR